MFVRVTCCAGFGMLPIYNRQNGFAGTSLLVKILIRNSRFNKASDAFLLYFSIYLVLKLVLFVSRFDSVGY